MREMHKKSSIYQVYIKSFRDSNNDGIGDLEGIRQGLGYIKELGVTHVWITPFLCSPQDDNGYDISDYRNIEPMYGTMDDFYRLMEEAKALDLGIMMDMVFNHTSSRHEWFQRALRGEKKYQDYYIFKDPAEDGGVPNNWQSNFGGSAWEYVPSLKKYYLHLYAVSQPDLNWENPELRDEIYSILNFWLEKGVKGFRLDVINQISKEQDFPDVVPGRKKPFINGPRVHEYVHEMNRKAFGNYPDVLTVGELAGCDIENLSLFTDPQQEELDTAFQFHHMRADYTNNQKWSIGTLNHQLLKDTLFSWRTGVGERKGNMSLFWSNHDQPRALTRFGDQVNYPEKSAKAAATLLYWMGGVPSVFQGEELGMMSPDYDTLQQYRDVESINHHKILLEQGKTEEEVMTILRLRSRDNGRTCFPWNNGPMYGFTGGTPWIESGKSVFQPAEQQLQDPHSIFHFYREMLALRTQIEEAYDAEFVPIAAEDAPIFAYQKIGSHGNLLVVVNLSSNTYDFPAEAARQMENAEELTLIQSNRELGNALPSVLMPWDAVVYRYQIQK